MSPFIDNKTAVAALFQEALFTAYPALKDEVLPFVIEVEKPKNPDHGHFAVNSALQLARKLGARPRDIAVAIVTALMAAKARKFYKTLALARLPAILCMKKRAKWRSTFSHSLQVTAHPAFPFVKQSRMAGGNDRL